jgi:3D (Asp-Asp-Asp) domain-containing protein
VATAQAVQQNSQTLQPTTTTPPPPPTSSGGRQLTVSATCYDLPGKTATGMPVGPGVVAVDPSVIPLGSRMSIPGYGNGVAADTGSGIQGATIDLWMPASQCAAWGRRTVTITVY